MRDDSSLTGPLFVNAHALARPGYPARGKEADLTPRNLIEPARLAGGAVLRSQTDERLVDLVRAGNDRAFEAIVHRYRRPLLRYCGRFLAAARAEDVLQQTFLNAYRALKADERPIELRPWLYRIAHNAALNALRAAAPSGEELDEEIDGVERPDQAFERREKLAEVVAAVRALPPRQRDAIVLHELEGRSYDQIAAELHVSGGAVRQLLSRARTTLRAGATAIVPEGVLIRLASGGGEPVTGRVAEIVAAGGGTAALAKVGTAVVVAGAIAAGASEGPLGLTDRGSASRDGSPAQASVAGASGVATAHTPSNGDAERDGPARRGSAVGEPRQRGRPDRGRDDDGRRGGASTSFVDGREDGDGDRSGSRGGSDDDESPGSDGGREVDDDRSGSGSGGESSGPGTGSSDESTLVAQESGDSGSGETRTESRSSSGSGSDDSPTATVSDSPADSSGPGSGSLDDSH